MLLYKLDRTTQGLRLGRSHMAHWYDDSLPHPKHPLFMQTQSKVYIKKNCLNIIRVLKFINLDVCNFNALWPVSVISSHVAGKLASSTLLLMPRPPSGQSNSVLKVTLTASVHYGRRFLFNDLLYYCSLCIQKAFVSYVPLCAVASYFRCCTLNIDYSDVHDTNVCDGLIGPS